jgi:hypothetical protein
VSRERLETSPLCGMGVRVLGQNSGFDTRMRSVGGSSYERRAAKGALSASRWLLVRRGSPCGCEVWRLRSLVARASRDVDVVTRCCMRVKPSALDAMERTSSIARASSRGGLALRIWPWPDHERRSPFDQ